MSAIPNSTGLKFTVILEVTTHKKEHFLLSAVSLRPLKPEHKSSPDPPHVCCCQISCLDNAYRRHCLDRNMICETVMSHHLT